MEKKNSSSRSGAAGIIAAEAIVTLVLLLSVTVIKYFFADYYTEVKRFYLTEMCAETHISEITGETDGNDLAF